jgi:hypothetical protein
MGGAVPLLPPRTVTTSPSKREPYLQFLYLSNTSVSEASAFGFVPGRVTRTCCTVIILVSEGHLMLGQ